VVDITEISAIVAAAGVLVGVVFTVLQLRDLVKTRQSDLLMRMHLAFSSKECVMQLSRWDQQTTRTMMSS